MPSFILRKLDPEFWARVQAKAKAEGTTPKAVILKLLAAWLGVVTLGVLLSACAPPSLAPSPVTVAPVQIPTALSLTASGPTSASESLLNLTVSDAAGKGVPGETIFVVTTQGTVAAPSVVTGPSGTAQLMLKTTRNATVSAQVRGLTATVDALAYRAPEPPVFPPDPPRPPTPPPPATCATDPTLCPPPPPPSLAVTLTVSAPTVAVGGTLDFTATVSNVATGDAVVAYRWNLDGLTGYEATTPALINTRTSDPYTTQGPYTGTVLVTTALGSTTSGTVNFFVTN